MDTVETPSPVDRLTITGAPSGDASEDPATALLALPWSTALEDWPEDVLAALPRGISRHVVRFARVGGGVVAVSVGVTLLDHAERLPEPSLLVANTWNFHFCPFVSPRMTAIVSAGSTTWMLPYGSITTR